MPQTVDKPLRRWRRAGQLAAWLLVALGLLALALWLAAPRLLEWKLRQELARRGLPLPELCVHSLTPQAVELEPLQLGQDPDAPAFGPLRVTYAWRQLLQGQIRTVELDSVRLVIRRTPSGTWELAGADRLRPIPPIVPATPSPAISPPQLLARVPGILRVRNLVIIVATPDGRQEFPFEMQASQQAGQITMTLRPRSGSLAAAGPGWQIRIPALALAGTVTAAADGFSGRLHLQSTDLQIWLPGERKGRAEALELDLAVAAKGTLTCSGSLKNGNWQSPPEQVLATGIGGDFNLSGARTDLPALCGQAQLGCQSLQVRGIELGNLPIKLVGDGKSVIATASVRPHGSQLAIDAVVSAVLATRSVTAAITLPATTISEKDPLVAGLRPWLPPELREMGFVGTLGGRANLSCVLGGQPEGTARLTLSGGAVALDKWTLSGLGADLQADLGRQTATAQLTLQPTGSALAATAVVNANLAEKSMVVSAVLPATTISEKDPALAVFLPALPPALRGVAFSATVGGQATVSCQLGGQPQGTAQLTLFGGTLALPGKGKVSGLAADIAADLGRQTATARLAIQPAGSALAASATVSANWATKTFAAVMTLPKTTISEKDPAITEFLSLLPPRLQGLAFSGNLAGQAEMTCALDGKPEGTTRLQLDGGSVTLDQRTVAGLGAEIVVDLGWQTATAQLSFKPPESVLAATATVSAKWSTSTVAVAATLPSVAISEKDPFIATFLPLLPPKLQGATFSATLGGQANITCKPGNPPTGTARLTLAEGKLALADNSFSVDGASGELNLESLMPLRSAPAQRLKFTSALVAGLPLDHGRFAFRLDPPSTIFIEYGGVGWCGGKLSCAAFRITGGKPDGMLMLRAEQVEIGQLTALAKDFNGHAEGWVTGRLPIIFAPDGGIRLGEVHLISDPEKPGRIQLDGRKWPGNKVDMLNMPGLAKTKTKKTLSDMDISLLRLDSMPTGDAEKSKIVLHVAGTPRTDSDLPPIDLTIPITFPSRQIWLLLQQCLNSKMTIGK